MKRTTLTADEHLINEIKRVTGASTQNEAVVKALHEFLRYRKRNEIMTRAGKIPLDLDQEALRNNRDTR